MGKFLTNVVDVTRVHYMGVKIFNKLRPKFSTCLTTKNDSIRH